MICEIERVIPQDHPTLAGHFPGRAIVPGVVLLDEIGAAISEWRSGGCLQRVDVKFLRPILPAEPFTIVLKEARNGVIRFSCRVGDSLAVEGSCEIS